MNVGKTFGGFTDSLLDKINSGQLGQRLGNFFRPERTLPETDSRQAALTHMTSRLVPTAGISSQDVQAEASQLISAHTSYFNLNEDGLGRELAGRAGERPELARAVYAQLSASDRVQVARAMVGAMSDDGLRGMFWSEDGRALLYDINRWVANNELTGDWRSNAQTDRALRERIGVALRRTDDVTMVTTPPQTAPTGRRQNTQQLYPPRYKADDIRRLYGQNGSYTRLDDWVNVVARGEGAFNEAAILRDGAGLSVGIGQWTQNSRRLGELMQRYRDVAERDGRLDEFHQVFGGRENAENLLQTLRTNPRGITSASIQSMFAEAGRRDVFQRAQIELAREEVATSVREIAQDHPYSREGTVSAQSMATALIVNNIGPHRRGRVYQQTINELYDELASRNPSISEQTRGRQATDEFKRQIVTANVSEQEFNNRLVSVAPRVLYTTPSNYRAHHRGLENRLRQAVDLFPANERVDPNRL